MDDKIFKHTFDEAITELSKLTKEFEELDARREELNTRIAHFRNFVLALSPLVGVEPETIEEKYPNLFPDLIPSDVGLTDAVRKVLQYYDVPLTAKLVRTGLQKTGYDIDRYSNILASLHTILKRLVEAKEVEVDTSGGATTYKWKKAKPGSSYDPPPTYSSTALSRLAMNIKMLEEASEKKMKERDKE